MKKLKNFFKKVKAEWSKNYHKATADDEIMMEVELWGWYEGEDIRCMNYDEEEAWALIKHLYYRVLRHDENWHFFYENQYNIIRCSASFFDKVIEELKIFGVYYRIKGEWKDGSATVEKYKHIYKKLFHCFTLMAFEEYEYRDIFRIYDRISHCFLNHQYYALKDMREKEGHQWEARLMALLSVQRADYTGYLGAHGVDSSISCKKYYTNGKEESSEEGSDEEEHVEEGVGC